MAGRAAQDVPNPAQEALDLVGVDPRRALDVAEALGTAARSRRDVASASAADRAAGLALRETGRLVEAERRLRRAAVGAGRTGAAQAEAEARMSLAFLLLERGKARSALHEADRAAGALHGVAAARLESQRALVLQRTGRLAEALAAYRRALRVLRRDGDRLWEARALNNRALLLAYQGSLTSARSDLLRARSLHEELGLTSFVADTDWNLGFVAGRAGEVPAALAAFDRAEASYAARGAVHPQLLIDRAEVLLAAGLHHEALATARRAVARV
ncbi:tetratricopeptide repeat protein, partial [Nostocoides japonicum]|uniref:tetratricopeptide repeat protein n=1 Tax=Nostocoides japonicum TaxID=99481 RepID=UPI00065B6BFC